MGFMKTPKYQKDPELEKQLKEQREEEERIKKENEAKEKKYKSRVEWLERYTLSTFERLKTDIKKYDTLYTEV